MSGAKEKKFRILYLGDPRRPPDPWQEIDATPPLFCEIEFQQLLEIHRYNDSRLYAPIRVVLVDVDLISQTQPLDTWAISAWRNSFNDLITRLTSHSDGSSPKLLAMTRLPTWTIAKLGVEVGARQLSSLEDLTQTMMGLSGISSKDAEVRMDEINPQLEQKALLRFPFLKKDEKNSAPKNFDPSSPKENADPGFSKIPRHTIPFPIDGLDGNSQAIEGVKELIRRTAPLDTSVLISGPSGSGKELIARSIHRHSSRFAKRFVVLHCASLNPNLIESELFGHIKGAFTDATQDREGLLAAAHQGTLFLDEISALGLDVQSKLLRVLSDRCYTPVGASTSYPLDVRVITATNANSSELVEQKRLREDLLFRLRVIEITLPSLSERKSDIPSIAQSFLKKLSKRHKKPVPELSSHALEKFLLYPWPGNVRELENVLEHASTLAWAEERSILDVNDMPDAIRFAEMKTFASQELKEAVKRFERDYILATVRRLGGSKEEAAEVLGLSLATLYRKLGS